MIGAELKKELQRALVSEKSRLEKALSGFAKRDEKNPSNWNARYPDFTDEGPGKYDTLDENADEVEEFETLLETEDALEKRLKEVDTALYMIETDKYGVCEKCGELIPEERLKANPATRFDLKHAEN